LSNQLKNENSPYLKQHASNPVKWFPWNKKSLEKAKKEKKPIFLSVGYASCHWCHVMAHESFENLQTAEILNNKFINIKVDREERPDLDAIFQKSLSILTGAQGGWPLSMFLDENAVPFSGGTYFPPNEMNGRPSFNQVLINVSKVYNDNREKIISQVSQLKTVFKDLNRKNAVLKQDLEPYANKIIEYLDEVNGGFKGSPKFPQFYIFQTLFFFYNINKNKKFLKPVELLLNKISSKGIYDHLKGGISRYTVDEKWIIPHFEKMLYDNIQYVLLLSHYICYFESNYLKKKLQQTLDFINVEFKCKNNQLGTALDADTEGIEGKYYTWKYDDLRDVLEDKFFIINKYYDISEKGNFEGLNILSERDNVILDDSEIEVLEMAKKTLELERRKRTKPFFDDKVQTDLNCFWLYSNLHASLALRNTKLYNDTLKLSNDIIQKLDNNIYHCYEKDNDEIDVFLEDYSYLCLLLISLYEIENDQNSLNLCIELMEKAWDLFYNSQYELLQKNVVKKNDLFVNPIDISDSNLPNGNSVYLTVCNKLKNITSDGNWDNKIKILSKTFHAYINYNFSQMFSFIKTLTICEKNITITFHGEYKNYENLLKKININFLNSSTIVHKQNTEEFFVVICQNQTCSNKLKNEKEITNFINNL
tara:strand:+ start:248 stop:2194 length:1947 start_codon:yes stop_codon:yes gene_type:complete